MANDNDYQLEEMENSAVNKSAMAKRAAMGAGLLAAGAATAYGAEQLMGDDGNNVVAEGTQQPDLTSGAAAGAVGEGVAEQPQSQPEPQTVHTEENVHVYHHYVEDPKPNPQPNPQPDHKPEMEYEETTHYYDDKGNLVNGIDMGTYAGKQFAIVDNDGDGHGDVMWYDVNGDGKVSQDEFADVSGSNFVIGSHGGAHHDVNINTGEEIANMHDKGGHIDDLKPEIEYKETTYYYDDEGNLVKGMDMGTYDGKLFAIVDHDGDRHGDAMWYDKNGDGDVSDDEFYDISGSNLTIGTHGGRQLYVNANTGEKIDYVPTPDYNPHGDSLADIHNDFDDEKSGEEYRDDLAQNNQDYRNHEDVHQYDEYHAGVETDEPLVAEEDSIDGNYDVESHEEDTLYAENYTLEDDNTEDYALNEEDNIESSDDSDMAYNDDVDENVDDADQYDIV